MKKFCRILPAFWH